MSSKANTDKALRRYVGSTKTTAITATPAEITLIGASVNNEGESVFTNDKWAALRNALNTLKANNPDA